MSSILIDPSRTHAAGSSSAEVGRSQMIGVAGVCTEEIRSVRSSVCSRVDSWFDTNSALRCVRSLARSSAS